MEKLVLCLVSVQRGVEGLVEIADETFNVLAWDKGFLRLAQYRHEDWRESHTNNVCDQSVVGVDDSDGTDCGRKTAVILWKEEEVCKVEGFMWLLACTKVKDVLEKKRSCKINHVSVHTKWDAVRTCGRISWA